MPSADPSLSVALEASIEEVLLFLKPLNSLGGKGNLGLEMCAYISICFVKLLQL